jgi:outer membrane protein TolC
MAMKFLFYVSFFLGISTVSFAQQSSVSLDSCIRWAKLNYPLYKQNELYKAQSNVNLKAIQEAWLPKMNFNLQAVYQSEVVQFNIPGFNTNFPHDSYLGALSVEQTVFDGGMSRKQKEIEKISAEIEIQKNEVELYKLVDKVNQLYMGILLAKESIKMFELLQDNLNKRSVNVAVAVSNGMVLANALDEIEVELLIAQQNTIEAKENLNAMYENLSMVTGKKIDQSVELLMVPAGGNQMFMSVMRPENTLLIMQEKLLDERYQLAFNYALPKITVGANGNYGRPGPNFINQNLRFFGSANIGLKWNVSTLYGLNREKQKFDLSKKMIEIQRENLNRNIETTVITFTSQIAALDQMMKLDATILEKKIAISAIAASQFENGKITSTVYLLQLNDELSARMKMKMHEIKRLNAWSNYNATMGLINF